MFQSDVIELNRYSKEIYNFLSKVDFQNPMSVTLTEKQQFKGFGIDNIRSVKNTKHFLNRLNQKIFKNSYRRYGKCIQSFVVMEGSKNIRHHIHMILERPNRISYEEFCYLVNDSWNKTTFGYSHIDIKEMSNDGWTKYILKRRTKTDILSDVDWENTVVEVSK